MEYRSTLATYAGAMRDYVHVTGVTRSPTLRTPGATVMYRGAARELRQILPIHIINIFRIYITAEYYSTTV